MVEEKRMFAAVGVPEKKIWGLMKRVDKKRWKKLKKQMNSQRRQSRCPSLSFQRSWSAGRAKGRRRNLGVEQREERGSIRCSPQG